MKLEARLCSMGKMIKSYRDLEVYQESYQLMIDISKAIKMLPKTERFNLTDQMRRASRSIPPNIAEGYAKRHYVSEFRKHLITAIGESNELEVHLETAKDLGLLPGDLCGALLKRYQILGMKLNKLIKNWKKF